MPSITTLHIQNFERDGYVALQAFLSSAEISEIESNLQRFIQQIIPNMPAERSSMKTKTTRIA
jgi:hypothetical protein